MLAGGGPAIRVRTVRPRSEGERWNAQAVKEIRATPDVPNPKDEKQTEPKTERDTQGVDFGARGGQELPKQKTKHEQDLKREFRITDKLLEKYGPTDYCKGCVAKVMGDASRPHTQECRDRMEECIKQEDPEDELLTRRDARLRGK